MTRPTYGAVSYGPPLFPEPKPKPKWVAVELNGQRLWIKSDVLAGECDGPLAWDNHIEKGQLADHAALSLSYAHYIPGEGILRFQKCIGDLPDLKPREVE
jgi:hypothetical protein